MSSDTKVLGMMMASMRSDPAMVEAVNKGTGVALHGPGMDGIIKAVVRSPQFAKTIEAMVVDHAKALAVEVLSERDGGIEQAVRRIVADRWDAAVGKVANELLDKALVDVRARMR